MVERTVGRSRRPAMILLSDPRVAAVPCRDDGDPIVDVREVPELRVDARAADAAGAFRPVARARWRRAWWTRSASCRTGCAC